MKLLVTGGAGFIGSAVVREAIRRGHHVLNVDKLTYAGNLASLKLVEDSPNYSFAKADICDRSVIAELLEFHKPDSIVHLAAESHVDRSIEGPFEFIRTNVIGTYNLLEETTKYYNTLRGDKREQFRFLHVSTDEVYGSLGAEGLFHEDSPYRPNSPYSATKASSDHLVRAWHHTYGLPTVTTNCSNNYGPFQFPEKLIPLMTLNAAEGRDLPVYGNGANVRDWLFVNDHAEALLLVLRKGKVGSTYNIGGNTEKSNLDVVFSICDALDIINPNPQIGQRRKLVKFVEDRPGHDMRYAIDSSHIQAELGWQPRETFESGLIKTIQWYLSDFDEWAKGLQIAYDGERLGTTQSFEKRHRSKKGTI